MKKLLIAGMMLAFAGPVHAEAIGPSFNCRYAYAPDEVLICQNKNLADLDRNMAEAYAWALHHYDQYKVAWIRRTQVAWLNHRHACGYDANCIEELYGKLLSWFLEIGGVE